MALYVMQPESPVKGCCSHGCRASITDSKCTFKAAWVFPTMPSALQGIRSRVYLLACLLVQHKAVGLTSAGTSTQWNMRSSGMLLGIAALGVSLGWSTPTTCTHNHKHDHKTRPLRQRSYCLRQRDDHVITCNLCLRWCIQCQDDFAAIFMYCQCSSVSRRP